MKEELRRQISADLFDGRKFGALKLWQLRFENSSADAVWLLRSYLFWTADHSHPIARRRNRLRLERRYGIFCGKDVKIGDRLKLPHPQGIIIGKGVTIGHDCVIYQQVTIGGHGGATNNTIEYPVLGDGIVCYAGAKVIGNIHIADHSIIGANSVVNRSTEAGNVYVGAPARKVEKKARV